MSYADNIYNGVYNVVSRANDLSNSLHGKVYDNGGWNDQVAESFTTYCSNVSDCAQNMRFYVDKVKSIQSNVDGIDEKAEATRLENLKSRMQRL